MSAIVSIQFFRCKKKKIRKLSKQRQTFCPKVVYELFQYNYNSSENSGGFLKHKLGSFLSDWFHIQERLFLLKDTRKVQFEKKSKRCLNPLLLQSNIQVNFEMFYQKYAFDIKLKAYSIHHCFGLTTDVFSMHLICNCRAIKRVL